jgi:hypothetical protein
VRREGKGVSAVMKANPEGSLAGSVLYLDCTDTSIFFAVLCCHPQGTSLIRKRVEGAQISLCYFCMSISNYLTIKVQLKINYLLNVVMHAHNPSS